MNLLWGVLPVDLLPAVAGRPPRPPFTLLHVGQPARADKHILFLSEAGASRPFAVLKWARGAAAAQMRREHEALALVRALPDPVLAASAPAGWGPFVAGPDALVMLESYLPAPAAYAQVRTSWRPRRHIAEHLARVRTWYSRFAAATRQSPRPFDAALRDDTLTAPLAAAAARFGPQVVPPAALAAVERAGRTLEGQPVALVAEHGDFWVGNMLLPPKGGLYVVDWEHFRPAALPGFDLLLFCTTYALLLPRRPFAWPAPAPALHRAYGPAGGLGRHLRPFLAQGCAAAGVPPAFVPLLLPAMMARMALRHAGAPGAPLAAPAQMWCDLLAAWWARPAEGWLDTWAHWV